MSNGITIAQIKEAFPEDKTDAYWTQFVLRPLSFPLAWVFIQVGLPANYVTYLSILSVIVGAGLFIGGAYELAIIGAIAFNIFALLDCADGNIARVLGGSQYGEWVDALGGYIAYALVFLSVSIYVQQQYEEILLVGPEEIGIVGAIAVIANLLMRVQHQKFKSAEDTDNEEQDGISIQKRISQNVGITGFLMPLVLLATIIGYLDLVLLVYTLFYTVAWFGFTTHQIYQVEQSA